jgi:maltooligosyltrehalose trehalohydrolase
MLAVALLLLSPNTPLLFMGEEYDEVNLFLFFTDYGDPGLRKAVSQGRRNEFSDFGHGITSVPDPQDPATFERSKLNWQLAESGNKMLGWYRSLIALRKKYIAEGERTCKADLVDGVIHMQVPAGDPKVRVLARIRGTGALNEPGKGWEQILEATEGSYAVRVLARSSRSE